MTRLNQLKFKAEAIKDVERKAREYNVATNPTYKERLRNEFKGKVSLLFCVGMIDIEEIEYLDYKDKRTGHN